MKQIIEYIVAYLPMFFGGIAFIVSAFKLVASIKELKDETSIKDLRNDFKKLVKENMELRDNMNKVLIDNAELKERLINDLNELYTKSVGDTNESNKEVSE